MFGDHRRLEKKLRQNGARGMATVTSAKMTFSETSGHGPELALDPDRTWKGVYHLDAEITPEQGAPFTASFRGTTPHSVHPGDQLPVLFDPGDHDKLCIDHERLDASYGSSGGRVEVKIVSREDGTVRTVSPGEGPLEVNAGGRTIEVSSGGSFRIASRPAPSETDTISALERLTALRDSGALTDAEFAAEKAKLLAE